MYLGDATTDIVNVASQKLEQRTATVESIAPDPQLAKFINIFVLGPTMIAAALALKPLSKLTKMSLMVGGIATVFANINRSVS